ncbi:MAG: CDP-glycerol glycerophosphotransferase family protein [Propionibacteriaceae bacterium]|nr:CDP-glycerol glycerophosphotransferase family protein [Propionibacteriaceae bacterium]
MDNIGQTDKFVCMELNLDILDIRQGVLSLFASFDGFQVSTDNCWFLYRDDTGYHDIVWSNLRSVDHQTNGGETQLVASFEVEIDSSSFKSLSFYIVNDGQRNKLYLKPGRFSRLGGVDSREAWGSLAVDGDLFVLTSQEITRRKASTWRKMLWEVKRLAGLIKRKQLGVVFYRLVFWFTAPIFRKQKIWLLADRLMEAGDNAESLMRYITTTGNQNISPYFVLARESPDFVRMQRVGKVIAHNSMIYKILALHAQFIISSHLVIARPFENSQWRYQDIMKFQLVFLQHGITKEDHSVWLDRRKHNIALFISATPREYQSLLTYPYNYTEKQVKLTGFPRFDSLHHESRYRQLLIMPTWRSIIAGENQSDKTRLYNPNFQDSEYFRSWNSLLQHPDFSELLDQNSYTARFCLHPLCYEQARDFIGNETVNIVSTYHHQEEIRRASILLTDYSSIAFDFAYLDKPVVYFQFDQATYFNDHTPEQGYFNYYEDGLGPVCVNVDEVLSQLVVLFANDVQLEYKYLERKKAFFYKIDRRNSERVYQEILALQS